MVGNFAFFGFEQVWKQYIMASPYLAATRLVVLVIRFGHIWRGEFTLI
jgi:hypothetical protein